MTPNVFTKFIGSVGGIRRFVLVFCLPMLGLALFTMLFLDPYLISFFGPGFPGGPRDLARELTDLAKADRYILPLLAGWLLFELIERFRSHARVSYFRNWFFNSLIGLLLGGALLHVAKFTAGRHRPYMRENSDVLVFSPFSTHWDFQSFPSGHSQTIFAIATMLVFTWPRLTWLWFLLAALIASTRVITLNHYPSDVLVGATIGVFGSVVAVSLLAKTRFSITKSLSPLKKPL